MSSSNAHKNDTDIHTASSSPTGTYYRIGTPGKPWGETEQAAWRLQTKIQRSYQQDVVEPLQQFIQHPNAAALWELVQYGTIRTVGQDDNGIVEYPLNAVKTREWEFTAKPHSVCITGGVHGYETSGVQGALLFLTTCASQYATECNMIIFPCVSPWSYERKERWNATTDDPNRCFSPSSAIDETRAVMNYLQTLQVQQWTCHLDLHETTDSDETEYMPARAAKERGEPYTPEFIPDGFFLCVNESKLQQSPQFLTWCQSILDSVKQVMPIAQADEDGLILGEQVAAEGIMTLPSDVCVGDGMSVTQATFHCTTELYPYSKHIITSEKNCNQAQVAAIVGALDYVLKNPQTPLKT